MPFLRFAAFVSIFSLVLLPLALAQEGTEKYYNVRAGPVYITLSAANSVEFNDNINVSSGIGTPIMSDIIIRPNIQLNAATDVSLKPETQTNRTSLSLSMSAGVQEYLMHPALSSTNLNLDISPDSQLSFDIHAGHFRIRVHDGFSLQSDPATLGTPVSNVVQFRRFVNDFGIDVLWPVNSKTNIDFGYDHLNFWALNLVTLNSGTVNNLSANSLNNYTDRLYASFDTQILSFLRGGIRGSVNSTTFPSDHGQDNTTYSCGPFANFLLTDYTSVDTSCGITKSQPGSLFGGGGSSSGNPTILRSGTNIIYSGNGSSDATTEYADITINNRLNTYYDQHLSFGRQVSLNLFGTLGQTDYIRYSSGWKMNEKTNIATSVALEDTNNFGTSGPTSHFRFLTLTISTGRQLSRKLSTQLSYRFSERLCGDSTFNYKQNSIVWTLNYRF